MGTQSIKSMNTLLTLACCFLLSTTSGAHTQDLDVWEESTHPASVTPIRPKHPAVLLAETRIAGLYALLELAHGNPAAWTQLIEAEPSTTSTPTTVTAPTTVTTPTSVTAPTTEPTTAGHETHMKQVQEAVAKAFADDLIDVGDKNALEFVFAQVTKGMGNGLPDAMANAAVNAVVEEVINSRVLVESAIQANHGAKASTVHA